MSVPSLSGMKTLHKLIIIAISCFCLVVLIFIQSDFFMPCASQPMNYSMLHSICHDQMPLQSLFSMVAGIGIASIVGISAFFSPKKSVIIILVLGGLYLSHIVLYETYVLSRDATLSTNTRIMRPMTSTEMMMHTVVYSLLWRVMPSATIFSSIIWPVVVLRKKAMRLLR